MNKYDVVVIGAGTAGLSAYKEATKYTQKVLLVDHGPLGTTCARVGCMPSKTFIHAANIFHQRQHFKTLGIDQAQALTVDIPRVLQRVRQLRDGFTAGIIDYIQSLDEHFINASARFKDEHTLIVGDKSLSTDSTIIATGSKNRMPDDWRAFEDLLLTSESFFEQTDLPAKIAVIGGGIIGLELGQAMARLGIDIDLFHNGQSIGGITDPAVNQEAITILKKTCNLHLGEKVELHRATQDTLSVQSSQGTTNVHKALISIGRQPNLDSLCLDQAGISLDPHRLPQFSSNTMQVEGKSIFLTGDANKTRPLLHEAADEGRIAGFNAAHARQKPECFKRRTKLAIIFTQPNIIMAGDSFKNLAEQDIVIGQVNFNDQGRAKVNCENEGLLRVYVDKNSGRIAGCEGIVPNGEHIAHLLAWAIQQRMTVFDVLQMPFYHPTVEEGMRTALRDAAGQVTLKSKPSELALCDSEAIIPMS